MEAFKIFWDFASIIFLIFVIYSFVVTYSTFILENFYLYTFEFLSGRRFLVEIHLSRFSVLFECENAGMTS